MAGSFQHCDYKYDGKFSFELIENLGDAHEACEDMHGIIWRLAQKLARSIGHGGADLEEGALGCLILAEAEMYHDATPGGDSVAALVKSTRDHIAEALEEAGDG